MSIQDQPEHRQESVDEDQDTTETGQIEEEEAVEAEEQGRYWLFNLLELLTPMPDYDD